MIDGLRPAGRVGLRLTVVLFVLLAGLLLVPIPDGGRAMSTVPDLAHSPLFAVLAALLLGLVDRRVSNRGLAALAAWAVVVGFGTGMEVLQKAVGREFSRQDMLANAFGAAAGVLWMRAAGARSRGVCLGLWCAGGLLLAAGVVRPLLLLADVCRQRFEMPQLASFEDPLELTRWSARGARLQRVRRHATDGSWSLRVELRGGRFPGATMLWPVPDWSGAEELRLDLVLEHGPPLDLVVSVEDARNNGRYDDRFHRAFELTPGTRRVRIALADVAAAPRGREMDLHRIDKLRLVAIRPGRSRAFYVDNVRLD